MKCTLNGKFKTCSQRNIGGSAYTYVVGQEKTPTSTPRETVDGPIRMKRNADIEDPPFFPFNQNPNSRPNVQAVKTSGGAYLALVQRLKKNEILGVPYSAINKYFLQQFNTSNFDPMVGSFLMNLLTYDPKQGTPLSYAQVYINLDQIPHSIDLTKIWDTIDGLQVDK